MREIKRTGLCVRSVSVMVSLFAFPLFATTITVTYGSQILAGPAGAIATGFDSSASLPIGFGAKGNEVGVLLGGQVELDVYKPPSGDKTNYAYVSDDSSLIDTFTSPISYFGLYWGSPDSYNKLTFTDSNGVSMSYSPGETLGALKPDDETAAYVSFVDTGAPWVSASFESDGPAFEFDNVTTQAASPTPEPSTIMLFGSAVAVLGLWRRRKRQ